MIPAAQWTPGAMHLISHGNNLWQFGPRAFRSAQPGPSAIASLADRLHLATVLDLTVDDEHDHAAEEAACKAVPILYEREPMAGVLPVPSQLQIDLALVPFGIEMHEDGSATVDRNPPGVLVHCAHGEDRSGVVCACYQMACGLPLEAALDDFRRGHVRLDGLWGEYWFVSSILEFHSRLKH